MGGRARSQQDVSGLLLCTNKKRSCPIKLYILNSPTYSSAPCDPQRKLAATTSRLPYPSAFPLWCSNDHSTSHPSNTCANSFLALSTPSDPAPPPHELHQRPTQSSFPLRKRTMKPIPRITEPIPRPKSVWMGPLSLVNVCRADERAPGFDGGRAREGEGEEGSRGGVLNLGGRVQLGRGMTKIKAIRTRRGK